MPQPAEDHDITHEDEIRPRVGIPRAPAAANLERYDLFLSHAREDKAAIARPLFTALTAAGVTVWFDEAVLELGDPLRRKIEDGLARCRYGVVIISQAFLDKKWPQQELDGLATVKNKAVKRRFSRSGTRSTTTLSLDARRCWRAGWRPTRRKASTRS
jgi:hypothetical protein